MTVAYKLYILILLLTTCSSVIDHVAGALAHQPEQWAMLREVPQSQAHN